MSSCCDHIFNVWGCLCYETTKSLEYLCTVWIWYFLAASFIIISVFSSLTHLCLRTPSTCPGMAQDWDRLNRVWEFVNSFVNHLPGHFPSMEPREKEEVSYSDIQQANGKCSICRCAAAVKIFCECLGLSLLSNNEEWMDRSSPLRVQSILALSEFDTFLLPHC